MGVDLTGPPSESILLSCFPPPSIMDEFEVRHTCTLIDGLLVARSICHNARP